MKFEALDITIESRGSRLWLFLSGPFHREQVPNIREKIEGLVRDGNRQLVVDMEGVSEIDESALPMFLGLLNLVRGKGGDLCLVYRNDVLAEAIAPYRNIFRIYPDADALTRGRALSVLWRRGQLLTRKTGVRLSRPVALFLLFMIVGWFLSLALMIRSQGERLREQELELRELTLWKEQTLIEVNQLQERLRPMEQLGILEETERKKSP